MILDFFENKCLLLGDEAHHNFDPLTRAIYGVGDFFYLPEEENTLFLEMLKPLLGFEQVDCEDGRLVSQVARMEKKLPGNTLRGIKAWDQFLDFWERVVAAQPNPETANKRAIYRLLEL